jgi:protein CpxP
MPHFRRSFARQAVAGPRRPLTVQLLRIRNLMRTHLPVLFAGLLVAAPVLAQPAPTTAAPAATATPATAIPATATPAPAAVRRDVNVERRITELHTRLKITPSEERPFSDFAEIMRENARRMTSLVVERQKVANAGNAVDQMKAYNDMAQAHATDMQRLVPAFSNLYDALSPDQKKLADRSFREFANGPNGVRG